MKLRIATLALASTFAACGALEETRDIAGPTDLPPVRSPGSGPLKASQESLTSAEEEAPAVVEESLPADLLEAEPRTRVAWGQGEVAPRNKVDWFRSGPYFGGSIGLAQSNADDGDISRDLENRGYTGVDTDLDDSDLAWKLFGGYRFEQPFALELAAVDLGTIESDVSLDPPADLDTFLGDLADIHPFSAKGVALTGTWYALDEDDWQAGLKGGLWWWDGEVEARAISGETVSESDRGLDLVLGAVGLVDIDEEWSLRAEVEHYRVDSDGVTFFSVGAQWSPQRGGRSRTPVPSITGLPPALLRRSR